MNDTLKGKNWLLLARVLILAITLAHIGLTVWYMPHFYYQRISLMPNSGLPGWTQADLQSMTHSLGLSPIFLGTFLFLTSLACLLCFWGVAILIFKLKRDSWIGLLSIFILAGAGEGVAFFILDQSSLAGWAIMLNNLYVLLLWPTFFLLFYLFPNGRFVPRWTRFLAPVPYAVFLAAVQYFNSDTPGWLLGALLLFLVGGLASQVYRYRQASDPAQRQQTKWVVFAVGIFAANVIFSQATPYLFPILATKTSAGFFYEVVYNYFLGVLVSALIPISIGFSILRYRLWDIDLLIRRTLVYAMLTVTLALFYFGSVLALQQVFRFVTGNTSQVAIVLSTLAIAALFAPLRKRVQDFIDQRFYRRKYDAAQALETFSVAARDEVELDKLTGHLLGIASEAMQPFHISLWLKPSTGGKLQGTNTIRKA